MADAICPAYPARHNPFNDGIVAVGVPSHDRGVEKRHGTLSRRGFLTGGVLTAGILVLGGCEARKADDGPGANATRSATAALSRLERATGRRIGVAAGAGGAPRIVHRGEDLFPLCSLFKTLVVTELLSAHSYDETFWAQQIPVGAADLVENSPITREHVSMALSVTDLADAALRYSDNTAGNLLLRLIGGPAGLTTAMKRRGAEQTRLDRWEPELNEAIPGDHRDSSTPLDLFKLFGDALEGRSLNQWATARLREWMLRNTTSGARLRRGVPSSAEVADKTGAGAYGVVNDAGTVWEGEDVLTMVIMTRSEDPEAANDDGIVRRAAEIVWRARS